MSPIEFYNAVMNSDLSSDQKDKLIRQALKGKTTLNMLESFK